MTNETLERMVSALTLERMVAVLNEATEADANAMRRLVEHREGCNAELADHPTIQVMAMGDGGRFEVGLLGILNGIAGAFPDGYGRIYAQFDVCCKDCLLDVGRLSGKVVGDACPGCGHPLVLGELLGFGLVDPDKHQTPRSGR